MARKERRSIRLILGEARTALGMTQREFGEAVGASHRSAVRWDAGHAEPGDHQIRVLARLLHPHDRDLAAEVADHADETLQSLGIEAPPPPAAPPLPHPPPPQAPALRATDLIDVVVLAAVEATGAAPSSVRSWLHVVFKRAREVGLDVAAAEEALRPAAPAEARAKAKPSKGVD